ncbi:MAG: hypothetical protein H6767_08765 [Candidatus Peribacteria bacterium]|nr:MAG: hypothetical protein H6767_08765 [Candidatus Peribacteria bacterium]
MEALDMSENKYFINIFNREAVLEQMLSGYWDTVEDVQYIIDTPPSDGTIIKYLQKEAMSVSRML